MMRYTNDYKPGIGRLITPFDRLLWIRTLRKFAENNQDKSILEVGCGHKNLKSLFKYKSYVATDVVRTPYVDEIADVNNLRYKNNEFDIVLCLNVLEHLMSFEKAMKECVRVAREKVIFMTPFAFPLHDEPQDFYRLTEHAYRILLAGHDVKIKSLGWRRLPYGYWVEVKKMRLAE